MNTEHKQYVWYVQACDYEACWPIKFFNSESSAEKPNDSITTSSSGNDWNSLCVVKVEVHD